MFKYMDCATCKNSFRPKSANQKYCSLGCRTILSRKMTIAEHNALWAKTIQVPQRDYSISNKAQSSFEKSSKDFASHHKSNIIRG